MYSRFGCWTYFVVQFLIKFFLFLGRNCHLENHDPFIVALTEAKRSKIAEEDIYNGYI